MRRVLMVGLLLAATSAHADPIWRLWCGNPPTARQGSYDTSAQCNDKITRQMDTYGDHCEDTKHGMMWKDKTPMAAVGPSDLPKNCRAAYDYWLNCSCRAEAVEQETK